MSDSGTAPDRRSTKEIKAPTSAPPQRKASTWYGYFGKSKTPKQDASLSRLPLACVQMRPAKMPRNLHPDPVDVEVGRRVRLRRIQLGLSQSDLGKEIGVTFQQVQKYEKGTNRVGASRLVKIAEVMDTSVQALTNSLGKETNSVSELLVQPHALDLLTSFSEIKQRNIRLALARLVEQLASRR